MPFEISFSPGARRDVKSVVQEFTKEIINDISALSQDPKPRGHKKLQNQNELYRIKTGKNQYRVVYHLDEIAFKVLILVVDRRDKVYQRLDRLK